MKFIKLSIKIAFLSALLISSFIAAACSSSASSINAGPDGTAIKGFDPVAYFTKGNGSK